MSGVHIRCITLAPAVTPIQCSSIQLRPFHRLRLGMISSVISQKILVLRSSVRTSKRGKKSGHGCISNASSSGDGPQNPVNVSLLEHTKVSDIITKSIYEEMFPYCDDHHCPARAFYTYEAFLAAAALFPAFGATSTLEARTREIAAFFGQTSHETRNGGGSLWGYCHVREVNPRSDYIVDSKEWPASLGQQYYGRGPIQLTFNWNYGKAGEALGLDLLRNPDLVATDAVVSFSSAIWFWMTRQDNKPSCHDVILGNWTPNEADLEAKRVPGYGLLTIIINPGECGRGPDKRVASRIAFFNKYCNILGVSPGNNLDCYDQCRF